MKKILFLCLLVSNAAFSGVYIYKDEDGQSLVTNRSPELLTKEETEKFEKSINKIKDDQKKREELEKELDKIIKDAERYSVELAKKPNAKIGMTTSQVRNHTNWGAPNKVNTTITANTRFEQWVYDDEYLYFKNGKLVSIQTSR